MRHGLVASLIAIAAFAAFPSPASAQPEVCGKFVTEGCGSGHKVSIQVPAIVLGAHSECMICTGQDPIDCHGTCQISENFSTLIQTAFQSLLAVANSGDLTAVLSLSRVVNGTVFYNAQRNAIQILDCTRSSIVASLNVRTKSMQEIAAVSLPAMSSIRLAEASRSHSPRVAAAQVVGYR